MEWNPPQNIEIKQSILNLFCNYSTFSLTKWDCDLQCKFTPPIPRNYIF